MFDSSFDRLRAKRTALAADCWGRPRALRVGTQHGIWYLDASTFDEPSAGIDAANDTGPSRSSRLDVLVASGVFTEIEIATLRRLVVDRMSFAEIAEADQCSRQAIIARLIGNSRGQGGILRKARVVLTTSEATHPEDGVFDETQSVHRAAVG